MNVHIVCIFLKNINLFSCWVASVLLFLGMKFEEECPL